MDIPIQPVSMQDKAAAPLGPSRGIVYKMAALFSIDAFAGGLAAVAPSLELALGLLLVRAALSQMDVPTRSSYIMAIVTPRASARLRRASPPSH